MRQIADRRSRIADRKSQIADSRSAILEGDERPDGFLLLRSAICDLLSVVDL